MEHKLTHFDADGKVVMVDVGAKAETARVAVAGGSIYMNASAFEALQSGQVGKGDVLGTARIAGIMAAKKTAQNIPLCHTLLLEKVTVDFELHADNRRVAALCTAHTTGKTGVEMEALFGVSTALLTIYDMCKALDKGMRISDVCLLEKRGGKSGDYHRDEAKVHD